MFQKRKNARYIKTLTPIEKAMPHIMPKRSDAQVFFTEDIDCTPIDNYIAEKRAQGIDMTYLDIFVAAAVRLYAKRPAMNRFVMGGRIFSNDKIRISMSVKKSLRDNAPDTTRIPNWVMRMAFGLIRILDRSSLLPAKLVEASPFHATMYITYLKSLGIPGIYHHIYDLGTIGQFIAVGKERLAPVCDQKTGEIRAAKVMTLMVVADERICDGLYYARSMRMFRRILETPKALEEPQDIVEKDID